MTYDVFWSMTFGECDAAGVVTEFDLTSDGLDEWIGQCTATTAQQCTTELRAEYEAAAEEFHARALAEISATLAEISAT